MELYHQEAFQISTNVTTLLFMIVIAGYTLLPTQEIIKGGDMENASDWTILDVASYGFDPATITFGYTLDTPKEGK